ncbi:helix-turn-helix transcriptional regulator [Actinomadura sp. KC345]|uniref:LuxR C-terminal-related transcriptional regulator n=1 Tax=Actinomadura sp. KC345 TaxID=2530371 RepID=UPI00105404D6|nr:LuxR C-terminal-related transcriptional regulator [Actinomadura sp. KC345]TDC50424.1 helix-turn-helix transcriptional regulator [Actinomadura sp. KC345]
MPHAPGGSSRSAPARASSALPRSSLIPPGPARRSSPLRTSQLYRSTLPRALAQAQAEGDRSGIADALGGQGVAALFAGDFDRSLELLGAADDAYRETGHDDLFRLLSEVFRSLAHLSGGDLPAAIAHAGQGIRLGEERGELWVRSYGMIASGIALWLSGELDESMRRLREALRIKRDLDDALGEPAASTEPGAAATGAATGAGTGAATEEARPLTEREFQVAALVAEGLSNRDIAERLTIAKRTADSHVEHILAKLGFSSRAQIAVWITAQGTPQP